MAAQKAAEEAARVEKSIKDAELVMIKKGFVKTFDTKTYYVHQIRNTKKRRKFLISFSLAAINCISIWNILLSATIMTTTSHIILVISFLSGIYFGIRCLYFDDYIDEIVNDDINYKPDKGFRNVKTSSRLQTFSKWVKK
jgi:hypothetical protein